MVHVPILRFGQAYESVEKVELFHHESGALVATVSQANSGLIARDLNRCAGNALAKFSCAELLDCCARAAALFTQADLPLGPGGQPQTFDQYLAQLSATTGMPSTFCRQNAGKIEFVLSNMRRVLDGLTRGLDPRVIDDGFASRRGSTVSFARTARWLGAVLPSNSAGVHTLWLPAVVLKTPLVLKPGREEPWTPLRICMALITAGVPAEAFGVYPSDHSGAAELLRLSDRSMLFGDSSTTGQWSSDPRVEKHGPGYSKIVLCGEAVDEWPSYLDLMIESITANAGRSCINASGIWTPRHAPEIASALARRLVEIEALPASDPRAQLAAFANPAMARAISASIDAGLSAGGARDVTAELRQAARLVERGRCAWLLPTIVSCDTPEQPLANREFLFPYSAVVQCPEEEIARRIGPTLVLAVCGSNSRLIGELRETPLVDRLNIGPIPTCRVSWDQPHEGNLFMHLYRQRAMQIESVA